MKVVGNNRTAIAPCLHNGLFLMSESDSSEYWVVKSTSVSRKRLREVRDISAKWVEEYGKFKTGEEKETGFFEEKGTGVLTCLGGEWRIF